MAEVFDVVIIGSGPGGYFAAFRCAQKGASVAIIEKAEIGGTAQGRHYLACRHQRPSRTTWQGCPRHCGVRRFEWRNKD